MIMNYWLFVIFMMMVMIMMILTKYIKADTSLNGKLTSQFEILSPGKTSLKDSIKKERGIKMKYRSLERTQTFKSSPILVPHLTIGSTVINL